MLLPTGAYDIEDIISGIIDQIEGITGPNKISIPDEPDKSPIKIHAHESLLGAIIEINSPNYAVDIYNSMLSVILGYPELAPGTASLDHLPPEPYRVNFRSSKSSYHGYDQDGPDKLIYVNQLNDLIKDALSRNTGGNALKFYLFITDSKKNPINYLWI